MHRANARIRAVALTAAIGALAAGCAPLLQAPLVYSSKNSAGLDISATSTESPGISLMVGTKNVDAAYVPVAVARQCDGQSGQCENESYKLIPLNAVNDTAGKDTMPGDTLEQATARVASASSRVTALIQQQEAAQAKYDAVAANVNDLGPAQAARAAAANLDAAAVQALDQRVRKAEQAAQELPALKASLDTVRTQLAAAQADLKLQTERQAALSTRSNWSNEVKRSDAFSVFGSFGSDNGGEGGLGSQGQGGPSVEGSLKMGKVFSTGLASQFLTEGVKLHYCVQGGLPAVDGMPEAQRQAMLTSLVTACSQSHSRPKGD